MILARVGSRRLPIVIASLLVAAVSARASSEATDPHGGAVASESHAPEAASHEPAGHGEAAVTRDDVPPDSAVPSEKGGLSPEEIASLLKLGAALTDRGDFDAAEIAYHQVLSSTLPTPDDTKSALLGLARMHRREGMLTKAAAIYEKFLAEYPGDARSPDALLDLGRTLRAMGAFKLAIARFYSVINSTLKVPGEEFDRYQLLARTAQYEIAETHFQAGNFIEANKFFSRLRLLDLAPSDRARAHFKAAYSLYLAGDLEGAVQTLSAYLEQWPKDENVPEARYVLAMSYRGLNRPQLAFAATLELLQSEQGRVSVDRERWIYWQRRTGNQLANDFFEQGDILSAQRIYASLSELSPEPSWRLPVTYQLALCNERLGLTEEARQAYQRIVNEAGTSPSADLADLARMAAWRRDQLNWRVDFDRQLAIFSNTENRNPDTVSADRPAAEAVSPQVSATP